MKEEFQETYGQITELIAAAQNLASVANWQGAMAKLNQAWELLPDPKNRWKSSTRVLAAIGEVCVMAGQYHSGLGALRFAMVCPGGEGDPLLHLRLGQCAFERHYLDEAAEHLARAYVLDRGGILPSIDPRYGDFLTSRMSRAAVEEQ